MDLEGLLLCVTLTTELYPLSLHDALPIFGFHFMWDYSESFLYGVPDSGLVQPEHLLSTHLSGPTWITGGRDRKSTRLNSSHSSISYAVFCLKKKRTG